MTLLEKVREHHDDADRFDEMTIRGNLIDVGVYAMIERYYAEFLRTQITYFPYMLKSQWREFYGLTRKASHYKLQDLIDAKVLSEGQFKGCHFVYPATRAMKWYKEDPDAKNMEGRKPDRQLIDCFMRAEFFLREKDPLYLSATDAFTEIENVLRSLPDEAVSQYLPDTSRYEIENRFVEAFGSKIKIGAYETQRQVLQLVKDALDILTRRNCYIKSVKLDRASGFQLEMCVTHFIDSSKSRYHALIQDISLICECFRVNAFTLFVLTDSEKEQQSASELLGQVFKQRKKGKKVNRCTKLVVRNMNIARYYQRMEIEQYVNESDLKDIAHMFRLSTTADPEPSPVEEGEDETSEE